MKIIMVMVSSLNGKITRGDNSNVTDWSSQEDAAFFQGILRDNSLFVMGSGTYDAARKKIVHSPHALRIVLTGNSDKYNDEKVENQLEFTSEKPKEVVDRLTQRGYKEMFLLGGGTINALFLTARLVDEIYLTIEPQLFGKGKDLLAETDVAVHLELMSQKQINKKGTLLLKYKVIK